MKRKIKVAFVDFWREFNPKDNFFTDILKENYDVIVDENQPEFLFYSVFGTQNFRYNCTKIFFSGENILPNYKDCDYSLSFHLIDSEKHYRLPLYALFDDVNKLIKENLDITKIMKEKKKFCNFIYSNPYCKKRNEFFKKLSKYKKVDSAGRLYNNIGYRPKDKIKFIQDYKFTIAFENEESDGYTTEKIFEPMLVNSIPIYWGNPLIYLDFNTKSFLNYYDYNSDEILIEKIIEIDNDDSKYADMLLQPYYHNNKINQYVKKENILNFLEHIIESEKEPISKNSPLFNKNKLLSHTAYSMKKIIYSFNSLKRKIKYFTFQKLLLKLQKDKLEMR